MDIKETHQLNLEEEMKHWWIRTRFLYLDRALTRFPETQKLSILEVGCGTGQNLRYLSEESPHRNKINKLVGFEPEAEKLLQNSSGIEFVNDLESLSQNEKFDLIIAMDVIEHIENDVNALKSWKNLLKSEGQLFITAPANPSLWSYHDEILGHFRRYTKQSLIQLVQKVGLQNQKVTYAFSYLVPPALLVRKLFSKKENSSSDLNPASPLINTFMKGAGRLEAFFGGNPFTGTSVVGYFSQEK